MKVILAAYEKKTLNSSGGIFTVLKLDGSLELSAKGIEEIPLDLGDQINIGNVSQIALQNITNVETTIEFTISSLAVDKKTQVTKTEIINANPIVVQFDDAFTVGAVTQSGGIAWNVDVLSLPSINVLSATTNTHKPRVECLAGVATQLFAAGTRKSNRINIRSDQFNGVSLGGSNLVDDNSGGFLDVGMVDYIDTSGELWAFNAGATSVFVDVLELV